MNYEEVEALAGVLCESASLTELEIRSGDRAVRLRRVLPPTSRRTPPQLSLTAGVGNFSDGAILLAAGAASAEITGAIDPSLASSVDTARMTAVPTYVTAQVVGVFHAHRATPAAAGDDVEEGQTLGQIEAMRLMNDCVASVSGRLLSVLVQEGQPVEYGQPLFEIVPA